MKVTVTFGRTGVVVPCRDGWTVGDLIQQATQRYKKIVEQDGDFVVRTHHLEYCDGGILDHDDVLTDLVEDKDKLIAVYEEQEILLGGTVSPGGSSMTGLPSPEPYASELPGFKPIKGGEIEVNSSVLMSNTPLMVRSSSESAIGPTIEAGPSQLGDLDGRPSPPLGKNLLTDRTGTEENHGAEMFSKMGKIPFGSSLTRTVQISGEHGPLGIHVVPYCSSLSGRALGLHIRSVEENSRSKREGIFQDDECIVKINDSELMDKSFTQSQDVFRLAMRSPAVRLEVLPVANKQRYEKSLIGQLYNPEGQDAAAKGRPLPLKPDARRADSQARTPEPATRPAERQASPAPEGMTPGTSSSKGSSSSGSSPLPKSPGLAPVVPPTSKKAGKKLKIDLKKGTEGLGFTVVTRDSSVNGPGPILVKNILPRGAAVKDGRLQSGDRILEVNGVDITGRTQEELVAMLRSTKQGENVTLVVARPEENFLPRELKGEQAGAPLMMEGKEQLMFEVPLNDSGSAGLGVSLKGNKSRETGEDLGIFIKSIIHGGAAFKDGRLRVNDQLIAINGEPLVGRSNHDAMETLRRSMSMEGNLRGMIQLVVLRVLDRPGQQEYPEYSGFQNQPVQPRKADSPAQPPMVTNSIYERAGGLSIVTNGGVNHMEKEEEEEEPPPLPHRHENDMNFSPKPTYSHQSQNWGPDLQREEVLRDGRQHSRVKSSKSMDLVADESNVGSLGRRKAEVSPSQELGPTLGLKKSSSLESLQTAVSEVKKGDLPFHRPRPHMVRGRGCNESFRAAIDKSYDGPAEQDDDDMSDQSSGRDTPASSSSRQGLGDAEEGKKDKKKKAKGRKEKGKGKGKDRDKKKPDDLDENDKKTKKKGFGLLRFGKKKEEKSKPEPKATLQKQKSELLSEDELEKMKDERERIEAKHQELRDRQARDRFHLPDVEDDDMDPNYARINTFRELPGRSQSPFKARTPSPKLPPPNTSHSREPSTEDPLDGLYAKVNKQRSPPAAVDSSDRIQQLRREYHQARREGTAPPYEELEARRRGLDPDPHRMPARGPDGRLAPRYEDVERQYASLPRRGMADPHDYPLPLRAGHREPAIYPGPQPGYPSYVSRDPYPRPPERRTADPRKADPEFYPPPPQQRGPFRHDVPPSPTLPLRSPRYDTMNRGGYRTTSPERFGYAEERHGDPRQKNPMTAAV
ncbi:partitioning defective 3 homolog B isoform X2 [Paramormyrops kingsleyae]|uniref:partitioning defective 3 homolog B isoform X2 n=1 Tax=Paramormyrops kingsleyae TaxID=1676925 RepID=UPI000CD5DE91|nr:partitioning defective 3 homolog B isoform X2 [Paramormyrops kingsleyae]